MSILILADHDNETLSPHTLNVVSAAQSIGGDIELVVCGSGSQDVAAQASKIAGVNTVYHADHETLGHGLAENIAPILKSLVQDKGYSHVLTSAGTTGKNIFPRLAALLDVQQISDITAVIDDRTFERPIYAGNALATVQSSDSIKVITVRPTAFDAVSDAESGSASIEALDAGQGSDHVSFVSRALSESDRPDLGTAEVVISGGRGLGSGENFALLEKLADKLNAAIGASRAAVDAGFVPNDYQVGQTGKVVAPQLYIAVGISGAIQHIAGMKGSKTIVAINKDPDAPIFQVADYGLVGDLFDVVPELTEKL